MESHNFYIILDKSVIIKKGENRVILQDEYFIGTKAQCILL